MPPMIGLEDSSQRQRGEGLARTMRFVGMVLVRLCRSSCDQSSVIHGQEITCCSGSDYVLRLWPIICFPNIILS